MTDTTTPDTLTITAQHFEEVRSAGADARIRVSERSFGSRSSGRIAALRAQLVERGFSEGDFMLQGIERSSWTWTPIALGSLAAIAAHVVTGALWSALVTAS